MTLKHTPGPWETDYAFIYANPDSELPDNANQGACIVVAKVLNHSTKRPLANARLISAAPDMLAAASKLTRFLHNEMTDEDEADRVYSGLCYGDWQEMLIRDLQAAITKATGE